MLHCLITYNQTCHYCASPRSRKNGGGDLDLDRSLQRLMQDSTEAAWIGLSLGNRRMMVTTKSDGGLYNMAVSRAARFRPEILGGGRGDFWSLEGRWFS